MSIQTSEPTVNAGLPIGELPQLLTEIGEADAGRFVEDPYWCAQEKLDGKRVMIRKCSDACTIVAYNRIGRVIRLPEHIAAQACDIRATQCLIDGELVGDQFHAFDLLELEGENARTWPMTVRHDTLHAKAGGTLLNVARTFYTRDGKLELLTRLRNEGAEGIVFKRQEAPYIAGRTRDQFKLKFWKTCSAIVAGRNGDKSSIGLRLLGSSGLHAIPVDIGNVTIHCNHAIPEVDKIVEVRYLYATHDKKLFQPIYLGVRDDLRTADCMITQLKYKP
jgi:bifunctional non-homologous end joining protein LigD